MSTRQIRRLRRDLEPTADDEFLPSSSPVIIQNKPKAKFSNFRELFESSEDSEDSSVDDSDSAASSRSDNAKAEATETRSPPLDSITKGHRGRNDGRRTVNTDHVEQGSVSDSDLDALIASNLEQASRSHEVIETDKQNRFECLKVEPRAFRVAGANAGGTGKRRLGKGFDGYLQGRNWLIPGVPPKTAEKLRVIAMQQMKIKGQNDPKEGRDRFVVEFSERYKNVETICIAAIDTQDPELFRRVLEANPYHVEVLLRASCIHTLQGQHEEAFRLLSLALQLLQAAIPPRLSPFRLNENGFYNTWIPSSVPSNLVVYRLLVLYMISLERQAQWETCLTVCKLLLLMDFPKDAAHALLHIDMYILNDVGIRLYDFSTGYAKTLGYAAPLHWVLPNFAFSMALEYFVKEDSSNLVLPMSDGDIDMLQQFLLLRENELGFNFKAAGQDMGLYGTYRSQLCLVRALLQYPDMIALLSREAHASELQFYVQMEPFAGWISSYDDTTDVHLLKCYISKSVDLWRNENMTFLSQTAHLIVELHRTERGELLLGAFRDLWSAFRLEQLLPYTVDDTIVAEFDLSSHSLPMTMQ